MVTVSSDSIKNYLHTIGRIPLLSAEQELNLAQQIQAMLQLREKSSLTAAEKQIVARGEQARKKMIQANLRLVVSIAKQYQKRGLSLLDLIQEGTIGLIQGIEKFDPSRGYKLSTYAYWWIRQSITRALSNYSRNIRLPIHITEQINKTKKAVRKLTIELGRQPTEAELADYLNLDLNKFRAIRQAEHRTKSRSLNIKVDENQTELGQLIADESFSPLDFIAESEISEQIGLLLQKLPLSQRRVIAMRYGLHDGQPMSFREISEQIGMNYQQTRQLKYKAMRNLRKHAAAAEVSI